MTAAGEAPRLVVIGGGIGGYTAAIRAARSGLPVTLVEAGRLGGTCLNVGCIPTKSLLHQSQTFRHLGTLAHFGVEPARLSPDLAGVMRRKDEAVARLVSGVQTLVRRNRITLETGTAAFADPHLIRIAETGKTLPADLVVIASGSEPVLPPTPGIDLPGVVTSDGALGLDRLPRRVVIIGGGVIGVEFAQIFSDFGGAVTIVERLPRLLAEEDAEIAGVLQASLAGRGVELVMEAAVTGIVADPAMAGMLTASLAVAGGTRALPADLVLVAVGRRPRLAGLCLNKAGVLTEFGAIATDDQCRTSQPHIYAVGDVRGGPLLAHKAAAEAECAVAAMLGRRAGIAGMAIPRAVYTQPEIAAVGLTEAQARERVGAVKIGRFPFSASGKAIAIGDTTGLVKVIADAATEQVLGVAMVGPDVTNLIGEATLAVQMELTLPALMETVHAHPTLTEALMEAARDAHDGGAIHLPPAARPAAADQPAAASRAADLPFSTLAARV